LARAGEKSARPNKQRALTITAVSAFIDDHLHRAVALVDRTWPSVHACVAEAVECNAAEVIALDPAYFEAPAIALGGSSFELAGTAIITFAVAERSSLDAPADHCPAGAAGGARTYKAAPIDDAQAASRMKASENVIKPTPNANEIRELNPHSITWSARIRSERGMVIPRLFATLSFTTRLNCVGCSTRGSGR
jgi:hypothetical protein